MLELYTVVNMDMHINVLCYLSQLCPLLLAFTVLIPGSLL